MSLVKALNKVIENQCWDILAMSVLRYCQEPIYKDNGTSTSAAESSFLKVKKMPLLQIFPCSRFYIIYPVTVSISNIIDLWKNL